MPGYTKPKAFAWTEAIEEEILDRFSGGELLLDICGKEGMPKRNQLTKHERDFPEFAKKLDTAKEQWAQVQFEEMLRIADDTSEDRKPRVNRAGITVMDIDTEAIMRSKLKIETRMKIVERMFPQKYAPPQKVEMTGKDGAPLVPTAKVSTTEVARRVAFVLARAGKPPVEITPDAATSVAGKPN